MTDKLKVFRNSLFLSLHPLFMNVVSLFAIPYIARKMGTSDFGIFNFATAFVSLFYPFAVMGLNTVMLRDLPAATDKPRYADRMITLRALSILTATVIITIAVTVMRYPVRTTFAVYLACLAFAFQTLSEALTGIYNALERMEFTAIQSLIAGLSLTVASVVVLYYGYGLYAVFAVYAAGHLLGIVVGIFILYRLFFGIRPKFDWSFSLKMLREGSHFFSMTMMYYVMVRTDIIILSKKASTAELGLYTAAMMLVTRLVVIPQSICGSLLPSMSNLFAQQKIAEISDLFCSFMMKLLVVILPGIIVVCVYSDQIMGLIFGKSFLRGSILLSVGIFSFLFFSISVMEYTLLTVVHKQKEMHRCYIISTIYCILANFILIHFYGSIGAAFAVVSTQGMIALLFSRSAWQYISIGLSYNDPLKLILLNAGLSLILYHFHAYNMFLILPFAGFLYLIGTHVLGLLRYNDILAMGRLVSSR